MRSRQPWQRRCAHPVTLPGKQVYQADGRGHSPAPRHPGRRGADERHFVSSQSLNMHPMATLPDCEAKISRPSHLTLGVLCLGEIELNWRAPKPRPWKRGVAGDSQAELGPSGHSTPNHASSGISRSSLCAAHASVLPPAVEDLGRGADLRQPRDQVSAEFHKHPGVL